MDHDEDPLDLLEDDDDGVIETILFFDEEEEKDIKTRTGCSVVLLVVGALVSGATYGLVKLLV
jgi:hypothetical protein